MNQIAPWAAFGEQLRHPAGISGRLVGALMRVVNRRPNDLAIEALDIAPGDDILELGFGPGQAVRRMAELAPRGRVYGIDQSDVMLAQALRTNRHAVEEGRVSLRLGRFEPLSYPDAFVDKILAVNVLYFWTNPTAVLDEAWRVLRPGGVMAIYATDAATMRHWKFAGEDTHVLFGPRELEAAFRASAFGADGMEITSPPMAASVRGLLAVARKR